MRKGTKSDLLLCLESVAPQSKFTEIPNTLTAGIVDATCLVHMITPDPGNTFEDYYNNESWKTETFQGL